MCGFFASNSPWSMIVILILLEIVSILEGQMVSQCLFNIMAGEFIMQDWQ